MKPKNCGNCAWFHPNGQKNPDGSDAGECRFNAPVVIASWVTPQGSGWQCGWPATGSMQWCRGHELKIKMTAIEGGIRE